MRTDYLRSFPDLVGSIHGFDGDDRDHAALLRDARRRAPTGRPRSRRPISCSCRRPATRCTRCSTGELPEGGRLFDVLGTCFRREPSDDPARMQAFHMHEFVHVGTPDSALAFRDRWLERSQQMMADLGLRRRSPTSPTIRSSVAPARCSRRTNASARSSSSCSRPVSSDGAADRDRLLQLPPRSPDGSVRDLEPRAAARRTPPAWASASSGSCWDCSPTHGLDTERWPHETRKRLWQ